MAGVCAHKMRHFGAQSNVVALHPLNYHTVLEKSNLCGICDSVLAYTNEPGSSGKRLSGKPGFPDNAQNSGNLFFSQ